MPGSGGKRDKTGLITYNDIWFAPTLADVLTVGEAPFGLQETDRDWAKLDGFEDAYQVTITSDGFQEGIDEGEVVYDLDPSFSEEPIESHAFFLRLKEKYGGTLDDKGKVQWLETYTDTKGGLTGNGPDKTKKNPLFGIATYQALKSVFRMTYAKRDQPHGLLEKAGQVTDTLPGGYETPEGRDWLWLPAKVSERGNAYSVSEELVLSPPGGKWPPGVYGLIDFG